MLLKEERERISEEREKGRKNARGRDEVYLKESFKIE